MMIRELFPELILIQTIIIKFIYSNNVSQNLMYLFNDGIGLQAPISHHIGIHNTLILYHDQVIMILCHT